jgi:hypothetical protein
MNCRNIRHVYRLNWNNWRPTLRSVWALQQSLRHCQNHELNPPEEQLDLWGLPLHPNRNLIFSIQTPVWSLIIPTPERVAGHAQNSKGFFDSDCPGALG